MANDKKQERKALKKAYKRTKWRTIRPWKFLTFLSGLLAVILAAAFVVVSMFDNTLAAFMGGSFWELENPDESAVYFKSDFNSVTEMMEYGLGICEQVEGEGAALLLNENNALPLSKDAKVSLFSSSSVNLVYGGTGSGNIDASKADTLKSALEKVSFTVNPTLWDFYATGGGKEYNRGGGSFTASFAVAEVPWDVYPSDVIDSVSGYGDAAIVTLSRVGGEGADLESVSTNYLALDQNEKDMLSQLKEMKAAGKVGKIVVLLNTANTLQVDFLKDNPYDIDAVLWIGDVGISGVNAVAKILSGEITPSGSLVDTYCYDNYSSPAMQNFVPTTYQGDLTQIPDSADTYMIYQEGIYVGYKYYETRYEDAIMGTGNAGAYDYSKDVAFPFGYGLSYTTFALSDMTTTYNAAKDSFEVKVTVTNTGDTYSGKKTVQIYSQSPYTDYDKQNGVEKPSVALVGFGKTDVLAPGASETLTITVDKADLASYDAYGAGTYIMDEGTYYLIAAENAHQAVNNVLAAKGYTGDAAGDPALVNDWQQPAFDAVTYSVSKNGTPVTNQLSDADINLYEGKGDNAVTYLTRSNWQDTFPTSITQLTLTDKLIKDLQLVRYDPADYESVPMPTLNAKNGTTLYQMIGLDYDDPKWEDLLDNLTVDEMVALIGDSFHWTMPVPSIQAPGTRDENGPQGLTASLIESDATSLDSTAFTSEDVMAATFNVDLMTQIGYVMGNNCVAADIAVLYGPGNNIHRTPYGGRNFEYYSEDGFLSGKMSAYEVAAIEAKGVHVVMKHYALNDCEQDRIGLGVWLPEQAGREIYLKAFQDVFEEGNAGGVMAAYTRWGAVWSGGNYGLMTGILRGEWGCDGLCITDNVLTQYVNGVDGILAGTSTFDAMMPFVTQQLPKYANDPVIVTAMREACHHNLYGIANSVGMNRVGEKTTIKATPLALIGTVRTALIVVGILFVVSVVLWTLKGRKFRQTEAYQAYKAFKKSK